MSLRKSEKIWVLGAFLGVTALLAALLLALVSQWTAGPIRLAKERNRTKVFYQLLLPDFDRVGEEIKIGNLIYLPVFNGEKCVGFIGQGSNRLGYAGEVEAMVGFAVDGKITAVQILQHKETPGLGANVCDRKFQRTIFNLSEKAPAVPKNRILDQFSGKNASEAGSWKISKDGGKFDYLTGATVSSRAVTALVDEISAGFTANREQIAGGKR